MADQVFFYRLSRKFVDEQFDVPEEAKEVMYYSLAIGHHLGIVDCLSADLVCPLAGYRDWVGKLPAGSEARRKMEGFLTFGEITVYREHCHMLACALDRLRKAEGVLSESELGWTDTFMEQLTALYNDPHMYLMIRSR
ncbi:formate hydrogenlyase maturation HycH family protein [Aeromonas tecta]|uniref:formate hydrogenlyase maturation HycH family protein n=1 Tax=Aeromonas tecta TaxID=324617 RepID=UPI000681B120|nr:formate hydrogenlyase maturation HycH family protein [Aeromonas tecta]